MAHLHNLEMGCVAESGKPVGWFYKDRALCYSYLSALEMPSLLENEILPVVRNLTNGGGIRLIETCLGVINGDLGASQK